MRELWLVDGGDVKEKWVPYADYMGLQAILDRAGIYEVKCARCGKVGLTIDMCIEEGDEWECPPCNERENARERAEIVRVQL